ncbi:MAG TPA: hypothetical protein HA364_06490 [Thermoplasmata archaeon]|nr:hypothetical protein [Thermoplasmata archaeon]
MMQCFKISLLSLLIDAAILGVGDAMNALMDLRRALVVARACGGSVVLLRFL